jgi:CheY-like chemotaxis protein/HPt (histidine-containing phosphotransfer) domain-containing protein
MKDVRIGDPVRLNQVLMNLAGNAIKFTEKGSVMIQAKMISADRIQFSIVDTGIGIPTDKMKSVFESFSQAHISDTRKFGGTGLGLSISKQLVELMGGNISVESQEGAGTTFSFEIDLPAGSNERLQTQKIPVHIDASILNGLKILVVDDNEYNRTVACDTLTTKAHVEITEATNGKEAVELLKEKDFDVVLMDVQMPVMNGFEATQYIREKLPSPKNGIPVIALTASVVRNDLDKCRTAGMNDYVPKPFQVHQLISVIAKATGRELKFAKHKGPEINKEVKIISRVTNLSYLEKFCVGDQKRMMKYINMFTESAPELITNLESALTDNDYEEIANQVHGFKTRWIMMGMNESKDLAMKIEQECRHQVPGPSVVSDISLLIAQVNTAALELNQSIVK